MLERDREDAPASCKHRLRADYFRDFPVTAFHKYIWTQAFDQFKRRVLVEPSNKIHGFERSENRDAIFERVDRTIRPLVESPDRRITVDGDHQGCAKRAGLCKARRVTSVQQIEYA